MDADLVLIHGFWSSPATWDRLAARLRVDADLAGLRIHAFGYESPKLRWPGSPTRIPDYNDISQSLPAYLAAHVRAGAGVAVVTHSQGGLILQRYLAWMLGEGRGRELSGIRLIVMLSCPNEGSEYLRSIRAVAGLGRHPQAGQLDVLTREVGEARRVVLRQVINATTVDDRHCPIPVYVYSGRTDNVVLRETAQSVFPNAEVLPGSHFSILDPDAPGHLTFAELKRRLLETFTPAETRTGMAADPRAGDGREGAAPPSTAGDDADPKQPHISNAARYPIQMHGVQGAAFDALVANHVQGFIGRDFVFEKVNTFLETHDRGYFALEGEPGIGKTAIMASLTDRYGYIHHFNSVSMGITSAVQFLDSVCTQLVTRYNLAAADFPADATTRDGSYLSRLLNEASKKVAAAEKLVVLVDALDEATPSSAGANPLFLPPDLPRAVFFILTGRPDQFAMRANVPYSKFTLDPSSPENEFDIRRYVRENVERMHLQSVVESLGVTEERFVEAPLRRSEGNFMYLRYVLPAIQANPSLYDHPDKLPQGLTEYYRDHWRRVRAGTDSAMWERCVKIIYVLCEAEQAVPLEWIAKYSKETPFLAEEALSRWRQFLDPVPVGGKTYYQIYHASFRDFLRRDETVQSAGLTLADVNEGIADQQAAALGIDLGPEHE
jgi:pimeloyl-ACP methyl ester carboxylesterase